MEDDQIAIPLSPYAAIQREMRIHKTDAAQAILSNCVIPALKSARLYQLARAELARLDMENAQRMAKEIDKNINNY